MHEENLDELIDNYVNGHLPEKERHLLEERIRSDTELAKSYAAARNAHQFLEHLYYRDLRQKLNDHDHGLRAAVPQRKKRVVALLAFLICILGSFWWINYNWSAQGTALKYFSGDILQSDQRHQLSTHEVSWQVALNMYVEKDYTNAWRLFIPFTTQPNDPHFQEAQWNILLCRLALDGATPEWHKDLDQFILISHGSEKRKGLEVKKKTSSILFRIASITCWTTFSAINPQII